MTLIFYLLLNLLHFINNLYCFIKQYCVKICLLMKHHVYANKGFENYWLENSSDNLVSKLPNHIAIIIGLEEISIIDITKLIDWCMTIEISYISFYDHKGLLQKNYPLIEKNLKQQTPSNLHNTECVKEFSKMDNGTKLIKMLGYNYKCNIDSDSLNKAKNKSIKIQFLSYLDGKNKIVSLTKQLSTFLEWNDNNEKDITSKLISENLNWNVQIPEPDLAIVFGKTLCSYGFLPWHTRITEFFVVPTHCGLTYDDFTRILIKYNICQQHYGK
ncbi:dehydrodolichyl diphosphate synthase complex subunit nus1 [Phymastichus coffea]|uniref:dehydrodolichyl diphosphate synthase complex subunit nus1 n=1 Tax=Phymastichus coffea TaxID=108790 RepID=UPI00273B1B4B|nr:dehydrodolichyl diphosphate synthase complex subunit nus1 [Phymastichus coffea]